MRAESLERSLAWKAAVADESPGRQIAVHRCDLTLVAACIADGELRRVVDYAQDRETDLKAVAYTVVGYANVTLGTRPGCFVYLPSD